MHKPIRPMPVKSCCCSACGNCTKSPTYDNRQPCCCQACGHCFKPAPVQIYQWYPTPSFQPSPIWCGTTTVASSANDAVASLN